MNDNGRLHRSNNFGKLPAELIHDVTITDGAARQYAHMHWRYGENGDNHEGQKSMAAMLGVSEKTISNRVNELVAHDWIIAIARAPVSGDYVTYFYHVFERQQDCRDFRASYVPPADNSEQIVGKPEVRVRVSRKGAGNPNPLRQNSSSDGRQNSSSDNPDSVDPDSKEQNKEKDSMPGKESALDAPKIENPEPTPSKEEKPTQSQTPAVAQTKDGWTAAVEATREALVFGKASYNLVGRYTSFLMGRIEAEQKTKRGKQDNGEWYLMQIVPGLKVLEIRAFGLFMATMYKDLPPLRTPAVVADYVGRFMGDPIAYRRFMIHASAPVPQEQKAWTPPPDAEDHSAEVQQRMAALTAKLRGKTA